MALCTGIEGASASAAKGCVTDAADEEWAPSPVDTFDANDMTSYSCFSNVSPCLLPDSLCIDLMQYFAGVFHLIVTAGCC